jgi:hypothetical protein
MPYGKRVFGHTKLATMADAYAGSFVGVRGASMDIGRALSAIWMCTPGRSFSTFLYMLPLLFTWQIGETKSVTEACT